MHYLINNQKETQTILTPVSPLQQLQMYWIHFLLTAHAIDISLFCCFYFVLFTLISGVFLFSADIKSFVSFFFFVWLLARVRSVWQSRDPHKTCLSCALILAVSTQGRPFVVTSVRAKAEFLVYCHATIILPPGVKR